MNQQKIIIGLIFYIFSTVVQAEHIPVGIDVLADCHGFFAKGKVKQPYKEKYTVHFYKESRPVHCTPFAWDVMFLVPFETVKKFTGKVKPKSSFFSSTVEFEPGDKLEIYYKVSERGKFLDYKSTVTVEIVEISVNGAALLKVIGGEPKAQQLFTRWVGTNYVLLDFSRKLVADRFTILNVDKL
jgi:ribosomal protein L31